MTNTWTRFRTWTLLSAVFPPIAIASLASAAELSGRIKLVDEKGKRGADVYRAVVYFTPDAPVTMPKPPAEPFEVATARKDFRPHVLTIPLGSTVNFPNRDRILHNVFSVSGGNEFDLGLYRGGESKQETFEKPGVVQVFCNVHHSMAAYIVVLDTPYYTSPERDGQFKLSGLPEGPGTLTVWHERTAAATQEIVVSSRGASNNALLIPLTIIKKRVPKHKNKFGKPYTRQRRGRDY